MSKWIALLDRELARRALKVCAVGDHCRIKGTFEGHGIFYWKAISEIRK